MSFTCYPIIISKSEGKELPTPKEIIDSLLDNSEIALRVIFDRENETFKNVIENPYFKNLHVEYIIVVLKYTKQFNA